MIVQNSIDVKHVNDSVVDVAKRPMAVIAESNCLSLIFAVLVKVCVLHRGSGIQGEYTKSTGVAAPVLVCLLLFQAACTTTVVDNGRVGNNVNPDAIMVAKPRVEPQLRFEKNQGQTDPSVAYLARSSGYTVFIRDDETVFALRTESQQPLTTGEIPTISQAQTDTVSVLRMRFAGANSNRQAAGVGRLGATSHYLIGNDPSRWQTHVPLYERVLIEELYAGIDLVYYGSGPRLEYDFIVSPGANPDQIAMVLDGASRLRIDSNGALLATLADAEVAFKPPVAYQTVDGHRQRVSAQYVLTSDNNVAFELSSYDENQVLVIDPVLIFSSYLGGSGSDVANAIAVDGLGNIYLTGNTQSADFPRANALQNEIGGGFGGTSNDVFITKLDPTGANIIYSTFLGGSEADEGLAIAVDGDGNAYLTGYTASLDFPTTIGAIQPATLDASLDAFVVKLSAAGDALLYSTYLGGSGFADFTGSGGDIGFDIAVDAIGRAYVSGSTISADFPTTSNALQPDYTEGSCLSVGFAPLAPDAFITVVDPTGSSLVYSTYLGGTQTDGATSIAIDTEGNVYVAGVTTSDDLPTTSGVLQPSLGNIQTSRCTPADAFVAKIDPISGTLLYATYLGGSSSDSAAGVVVDSAGNAIVTGTTTSDDFPVTANAIQPSIAGLDDQTSGFSSDIFVAKLTPGGETLDYATFFGGISSDVANAIAIDSSGDVYITGVTSSTDFPVTENALQSELQGGFDDFGASTDAFVIKLALDGSSPRYSTFLGGSGESPFNTGDRGTDIAVDGREVAYISGFTNSPDLATTANAFQPTFAGGIDVFGLDGDGFIAMIAEASQIAAAVLPNSRSVQVGEPASAFATIINAGSSVAVDCTIMPITDVPGTFFFQVTDPDDNRAIGERDSPSNIGPLQAQSFLFVFTPDEVFGPTEVVLSFDCANTEPSGGIRGIQTLLLSASIDPVPDILTLTATINNNGIMELTDKGLGVFAVATTNLGSSADMTVIADTGDQVLPIDLFICQTDPLTSLCLGEITAAAVGVSLMIGTGQTPTFAVFSHVTDPLTFSPAFNRVFIRFKDSTGIIRGSSSVAIGAFP